MMPCPAVLSVPSSKPRRSPAAVPTPFTVVFLVQDSPFDRYLQPLHSVGVFNLRGIHAKRVAGAS